MNVSLPPNTDPCTWSAIIPNSYIAGCADGGYPCDQYGTLAEAQAACAADYDCNGITSQPGGTPPWETRHGTTALSSNSGEASYLINNGCHGDSGECFALPATFAVVIASGSFSNDVLVEAVARYTSIINTQYDVTTVLPGDGVRILTNLSVAVASGADATLQFGVDESYTLSIAASGATVSANTIWGALRGLETASQLARHTWTVSAAGAINASFNEVCEATVVDAPRFPYRGLMLDTARHFLPLSVIKQAMDLMSSLKMNALRLHLIDTDSWPLYIPELPIITNTSAYSPLHVYYPKDLVELVAYGRARGIIVYPEVDFPSHSQSILASIPEMGCLTPGPNPQRIYIDPTYDQLWPTMGKIFGPLSDIFPPEYPIGAGGDEVDRNEWALCPSVIAWGAAHGIDPANLANAVTDWWYTSIYNFLAQPPYNRVVFFWEDATDAVNASWVNATTGNLVIEQWNGNPGVWPSDTCSILQSANSSVLISGPFHDVIGTAPSFNSNPEQNYADVLNLTSSCDVTPRVQQQVVGPQLMFWDDAADISSSDLILMLMSAVVPVAESGWSPQAIVATGAVQASRYEDMRCRMARRGMQSHDAYGHVSTFCITEYDAVLMPWSV